MKVLKFGGSSVADAAQIKKVKDIILSDPARKFVIVSAPGKRFNSDSKVTDMLYECWDAHNEGIDASPMISAVVRRFRYITDEIFADRECKLDLDALFEEFAQDVYSGKGRDHIASRGEYLCAKIVAEYMGFEFVDAKDVIFFNENGVVDAKKTSSAIRKRVFGLSGVVIPGFYGAMPDGSIKTFKRGGGDITGSIVARAVRPMIYENWTDVDGFLMANPKIVDNPMVIKYLTYREMRELSYMGASVLQEESIAPAREAGISINIRNTNNPSAEGTMIVDESLLNDADDTNAITGIAGNKNFKVITVEKEFMNEEVGFGRRVLEVLEKYDVPFEHMPSGIDTLSIVINGEALKGNVTKVMDDIKEAVNPDNITMEDGIALIAIVGRKMVHNVGTAARILTAISKRGINVRTIDQGSDELNIIIGVYNDDFDEAIRAIYEEFAN